MFSGFITFVVTSYNSYGFIAIIGSFYYIYGWYYIYGFYYIYR